jgi:hypothetical protein
MFGTRRISINSRVRDQRGRSGKVEGMGSSPIDGQPAAYIVGRNPLGGTFADWVSMSELRLIKTAAAKAEAFTA